MTSFALGRAQRWSNYLRDLRNFAEAPQSLDIEGSLVRVTGLVLEAAGVRAPVGAVCEVACDGQPPVLAEVVGFSGDRAYLMPTGEVHGLASGARVTPRPAPLAPPKLGVENHLWRRREDRGLHVVGAAVILALIIALMLKTRVARASVVIVCVLFGLVLGASPIGDGVNAALAVLGRWSADRITEL